MIPHNTFNNCWHRIGAVSGIVLLMLVQSGKLYAQKVELDEKEIPQAVVKAIETDFPFWKNIKWYAYDNDTHEWANVETGNMRSGIAPYMYVVEAKGKNVKTHAVYNRSGKLLRSKTVLTGKVLPEPIMKTITGAYTGWSISGNEEVIRDFDANKKYYKVVITKGNDKQTLYFDNMGNQTSRRKV